MLVTTGGGWEEKECCVSRTALGKSEHNHTERPSWRVIRQSFSEEIRFYRDIMDVDIDLWVWEKRGDVSCRFFFSPCCLGCRISCCFAVWLAAAPHSNTKHTLLLLKERCVCVRAAIQDSPMEGICWSQRERVFGLFKKKTRLKDIIGCLKKQGPCVFGLTLVLLAISLCR
jgi:hypothetical protein